MRGKNEEEILAIFTKNGKNLCGLFEADRISVKTQTLPKWQKWLAIGALTIGFTGLYQTIMAQQLSKENPLTLEGSKKTNSLNNNEVFGGIEEQASFPGGPGKFLKYIATHLAPDESCAPGLRGFYTFVIEKDGRITDVKVLRSPFSAEMNKRVVKMLESSPHWNPGLQNGKPVRSQFTMPVTPVAK
ncbi:hypothetical protein GCM10028826_02350 [Mucilaginibacter boryungensis]